MNLFTFFLRFRGMNIFGHILTVLLRNTFTFLKNKMYDAFDCIVENENFCKLISSVAIKKIERTFCLKNIFITFTTCHGFTPFRKQKVTFVIYFILSLRWRNFGGEPLFFSGSTRIEFKIEFSKPTSYKRCFICVVCALKTYFFETQPLKIWNS